MRPVQVSRRPPGPPDGAVAAPVPRRAGRPARGSRRGGSGGRRARVVVRVHAESSRRGADVGLLPRGPVSSGVIDSDCTAGLRSAGGCDAEAPLEFSHRTAHEAHPTREAPSVRIFVTGGAGFIGSHYVRTLLTGGYPGFEDAEVTVFDKLTYAGNLANLAPVADNPRLPVRAGRHLQRGRPGRGAARARHRGALRRRVPRRPLDRRAAADFVLTNVLGTQQLLDAAVRAGVDRFVHVSTDEVYGSIDTARGPRTPCSSRTRPTRRPRPAATSSPAPTPRPTG